MTIHKDALGLVVDVTGDGGDSAHFTGLYLISRRDRRFTVATGSLTAFLVRPKGAVRHPIQAPWNNPGNFTRDQMMPLVAAIYSLDQRFFGRQLFWQTVRRFGFAQNFERDYPGSRKYPWPHVFTNMQGKREWRLFDFADPMYPHQLAAMAKAAGYSRAVKLTRWLWYPFLRAELLGYKYSNNHDMGQIISTCYILGELVTLKKVVVNWREKLRDYFNGWRSKQELCKQMERWLDEQQ